MFVSLSVCWTRPDAVDGRQRLRCSGAELRSVLLHAERSNGRRTEATPNAGEWRRAAEVHGDFQQELPEGLVSPTRRSEVPDRGLMKYPFTDVQPSLGYGYPLRGNMKSDI